jgi:hypothetical protein
MDCVIYNIWISLRAVVCSPMSQNIQRSRTDLRENSVCNSFPGTSKRVGTHHIPGQSRITRPSDNWYLKCFELQLAVSVKVDTERRLRISNVTNVKLALYDTFILMGYNCYSITFQKCHDSSVGITLGYGLNDRGSRVRFPATAGNFSLHHRVQKGSGVHPGALSLGIKRLGREADHLPPCSAEAKEWMEL